MKRRILLLILGSVYFDSYGAETIITLDNVKEIALARNESMAISRLEIEKAENEMKSVRSDLFPKISASAGVLRSRQAPALFPMAPGSPPIFDNWQRSATIGLNQPVYTFGRLSGAVELAKTSLEFAETRKDVTEAEVEKTAKVLLLNILFYEKYLKIAKDSYANALKNSQALNKRVSYGRVSQNQNLKMSADLASREPVVIEAEKNLKSMILQLKNFLGFSESDSVKVMGDIEKISENFQRKENISWNDLSQVKFLNDQLKMNTQIYEIEKLNYFPTLGFAMSYGRLGYYEDFNDNNFLTQDNVNIGLTLTFDLPTGGQKSFEQTIAKVNEEVSRLSLQQGLRDIKVKIKDMEQKISKLESQITSNKKAVDIARRSYSVALKSFSSGAVTQTELNDSELLLTQNKVNLASNYLEIKLVKIELEALMVESNGREER